MEYGKLGRKNREKYLDKMVLGRRGYLRHGLLGQGTFSDVYCVEDAAQGRLYACKISEKCGLLEKEAQTMVRIRHPLFPEYEAFWEESGLGVLLREYVPGESLERALRRRGFSARQTIRTGLALAEGLQYLHEMPEPFLFRDIKPANVIVRQDGGVALIDFGCVCSLKEKTDSLAGSPGFAAPEQLRDGADLTKACDVYGLGQTLKAMLGTEKRGSGQIGHMLRRRLRCPGMLQGQWLRREMREQKKLKDLEKQLWRVLEACTQDIASCRIPDMEGVIEVLSGLDTEWDSRNRH